MSKMIEKSGVKMVVQDHAVTNYIRGGWKVVVEKPVEKPVKKVKASEEPAE